MHDQMSDGDLGCDVPSPEETISTEIQHSEFQNGEIASNRMVESENKKSSDGDTSWNSVDLQEHKSKRGRRKSGSKKHRAGRNQRRKYVPFHKKTLAQQKKADEYSKKRANRQREFLIACGLPRAPHNTSLFLMEDAQAYREEIDEFVWERDRFEFTRNSELVEEIISLEDKIELWTKVKVFHDEMRRYEKEIEELQKLNTKLEEKVLEKKDHTLEKDLSSLDIGTSV